jgi:hypothetical protein
MLSGACGGPGAPAVPGTTAAPLSTRAGGGAAAPTATATGRCRAAQLTATAATLPGPVRSSILLVTFTNTDAHPCAAYGFPGLVLSGAVTPTVLRAAQPPQLVTVPAGASADVVVVVDRQTVSQACPSPTELRIVPPEETAQLTVRAARGSGPMDLPPECPGDRMTVYPVAQRPYAASASDSVAVASRRCRAVDLAAQVVPSAVGNGMGHLGLAVWLVNRSGTDCALHGQPVIVPDDGSGAAGNECGAVCPADADRILVLPAGAVLTAEGSTTNGAGDEGPCGVEHPPFYAVDVRIYLPDEPAPVVGPFGRALYCHGSMQVNPFTPS